jgi:hypothetical protein
MDLRQIIRESVQKALRKFSTPIKVGDFVLHTANPRLREVILKNGLQPQVGDSYSLHWDGEDNLPPVIFATNDSNNAYNSTYDDDVWKIDTRIAGVEWFNDDGIDDGKAIVTYQPISPSSIELVYKGTPDKDDSDNGDFWYKKNHLKESQHVLNEFITNNEIYLRDYLSMSKDAKKEDLPHEFHYFFDDFLTETGTEFHMPKETRPSNYADEPEEEVDMFEDTIELMTWLQNNDREVYDSFSEYLYEKIQNNELPISDSEYPAWSYFDDSPKLVKNQWLIHFTDNANEIARDGFKFGVDEMTKLGLTTQLGEFDKKYGGYNFAYLLSDFPKYAMGNYSRGLYKYGKEVVVFNASGIKVWHHGDEEPQVIFYGNTATNIIPITDGENSKWAIHNKNGRIVFENDNLEKVVSWLTKNYQQYRSNF